MSVLHIACKYGCENVANLIINRYSMENLLLTDDNKMLALHYACGCKIEKPIIVKNMIEKFQSLYTNENISEMFLSRKNKYGDTPLNLAVKENHLKIVEILLKYISVFKCHTDNENLPIHYVAKTGSIEMLKLFETHNLISFEPNSKWNNILHISANENREQFILFLFDNYEFNSKYDNQFSFAINAFNKDNFTPLERAIVKGSLDCVKLFLERQIKGGNVDIKLFEISIEYNQIAVLEFLIECNRKKLNENMFLNGINSSNNTILHIACIHKNFKLFKIIIEYILKSIYFTDYKFFLGKFFLYIL